MKPHEDLVRLRHMLDYTTMAQRLASDCTRRDLDEDDLLRLGLTRAVEVIGEAAAKVSSKTRDLAPEIPWDEII